jgi:hypothetical protein
MLAKPKKEKSEKDQIQELESLMDEQVESAVKRATADPKKTSATWIGSGDFMILLLCDASSIRKPTQKRYTCRILDVKISGGSESGN